jgi:hypothetical protein
MSSQSEQQAMTPLFTKLNLGAHREIVVLDAPETFEAELAALTDVKVRRSVGKSKTVPFVIVFVKTLAEVEAASNWLPKAEGDAIVWFAYPKGTSKKYQCEFNRDNGWAAVSAQGFETVRQVAIDEDWSALRFRRNEFVRAKTK